MKNKKRIIIIGVVCYIIIASFLAFKFYKDRIDGTKNYKNKYVLSMLKKSEILENEIGKVRDVNLKTTKQYSYKDLGYWAYYEDYIITNENDEEYNIKIIFNSEFTLGIYAYEIDDKIIYEDIEKVQPNINSYGEIII